MKIEQLIERYNELNEHDRICDEIYTDFCREYMPNLLMLAQAQKMVGPHSPFPNDRKIGLEILIDQIIQIIELDKEEKNEDIGTD